jgi:1,4-alpha-glucan branching enzyme
LSEGPGKSDLDEASLSNQAIEAIVKGLHGDPFAVLGPHQVAPAPNACRVSVIADFNDWDGRQNPMRLLQEGGIWELFVPDVSAGVHYKFEIIAQDDRLLPLKTDPLAFAGRVPARNGFDCPWPARIQLE